MRAKSREEVERLKEAYTKERNDCIKSGLKSVALAVAIIEITKAIMYFIKNWPTQANLKKLEEEARRTGDKQDAQLELYNLALDKIAAISQLVMNGKMDITEAKKRFMQFMLNIDLRGIKFGQSDIIQQVKKNKYRKSVVTTLSIFIYNSSDDTDISLLGRLNVILALRDMLFPSLVKFKNELVKI